MSTRAVKAQGYPRVAMTRDGKPLVIFRAVDGRIAKELARRQRFDARTDVQRQIDAKMAAATQR